MAFFESAVALTLVYLAFSVVASGVQEWVAQYTGRRGKFLKEGLSRLISDDAVLLAVLQHPLVGGMYRDDAATGKPPSYLDPKNFALAIANVIVRGGKVATAATVHTDPDSGAGAKTIAPKLDHDTLRKGLETLAANGSPVASAMLPIVDVGRDIDDALQGVEAWFNSGMDRVSGWYKARTQKILFAVGLFLAIAANVDTLAIIGTLARSPDLRTSLAGIATDLANTGTIAGVDLGKLKDRAPTDAEWRAVTAAAATINRGERTTLPLGYACLANLVNLSSAKDAAAALKTDSQAMGWDRCARDFHVAWNDSTATEKLLKLLGWIVTALAGVLGAPFWFSALVKIVNLRGSGPKPAPTAAA
jgi:hypothetical protein